jgi:hypothetical protein
MSRELDVMVRDRGEGKTTETILWLLRASKDEYDRPRRVLLCVTEQRANFILSDYPALKGFVFSQRQWQEKQIGRGFRDVEVALDDAEALLRTGIPNLTRITMTGNSI